MNELTFGKQPFPIINSFNKANREKSNDLILVLALFGNRIEVELGSMSSNVNGNRSARIGETSIHSIIFIQILVIDLDSTYSNELGR